MRDLWDRVRRLGSSAFHWPRRGSRRTRIAILLAGLLIIGVAAWLVADNVWRDRLPRSSIAFAALVAAAALVLWLFGPSGWRTASGVLGAVVALLITAGTALDLDHRLPAGPPERGALVDCPDFPDGYHAHGYTATTDLGYTLVRSEPNMSSPVLRKYPPGCDLAFDSYCLGEPKSNWRFDTLDPVWFSLHSTSGYVPSADIRAGPSGGSIDRKRCEGGIPGPRPIELTAPAGHQLQGAVEVVAAAPRAIQVGFAVYYPQVAGRPETSEWQQIGVDLNTGDGAKVTWDSRSVPGQGAAQAAAVSLLAVPCLGLEFPARKVDVRTFVDANGGGSLPDVRRPPSESIVAARVMACDNIER